MKYVYIIAIGLVSILGCTKDKTKEKFNSEIYGNYLCRLEVIKDNLMGEVILDTVLVIKIEETENEKKVKVNSPCKYGISCNPAYPLYDGLGNNDPNILFYNDEGSTNRPYCSFYYYKFNKTLEMYFIYNDTINSIKYIYQYKGTKT